MKVIRCERGMFVGRGSVNDDVGTKPRSDFEGEELSFLKICLSYIRICIWQVLAAIAPTHMICLHILASCSHLYTQS